MKSPAPLLLLALLALADPYAAAHDVHEHDEPTQAEITRRIDHARGLAEAKGRMVRAISGDGFADAASGGAVYTGTDATGPSLNPRVSARGRICGTIRVGDITQRVSC